MDYFRCTLIDCQTIISKNWTVDNYLSLVSLILVMIGGIFALCQLKKSVKTKRAEFLEKLNLKTRFDKKMALTMYKIEYEFDWYDKKFHEDKGGLQYSIDKLLSYFDYICYLKKLGNITKKEFVIFEYRINRILVSPCVISYLWNLYHFTNKNDTRCSFKHLIDYGIEKRLNKKRLIDKSSFEDPESKKYIKVLFD